MRFLVKELSLLDKIKVEDGVVVGVDTSKKKFSFVFTSKSFDIFEKLRDQDIMSAISKFSNLDTENPDFSDLELGVIKDLAACAFVKVENGAPLQNEFTAQEFLEVSFANEITFDQDFLLDLITLFTDNIEKGSKNKKKKNNGQYNKSKKK